MSIKLFKFTAIDIGYFRITPNSATGSCLDVKGKSTADGAVVQLYQWSGGSNQQWAAQSP
jgi:glucosylceramidase